MGEVYVNPHQVVALQLAVLQRLVGLDSHAAGRTPGIPEVYEDDLALVGCDDGVEELLHRHIGRLLDDGFPFDGLEQSQRVLLHLQQGFAPEGVLHAVQRLQVGFGEGGVRGFFYQRQRQLQCGSEGTFQARFLGPCDSGISYSRCILHRMLPHQ